MELNNERLRTIPRPFSVDRSHGSQHLATLGSVTGWPNQLSFGVGVEYEGPLWVVLPHHWRCLAMRPYRSCLGLVRYREHFRNDDGKGEIRGRSWRPLPFFHCASMGGAVLGSGYSFKIGYDDILLN